MAHDRMTLSGTMISGNHLYAACQAWNKKWSPLGKKSSKYSRNYRLPGNCPVYWLRLFRLAPWAVLAYFTALVYFGLCKNKSGKCIPASSNLSNSPQWKLSLFGQLCFVILGFSLAIGGMVISVIGASHVFVPTDLAYLCLTPEALNEFNDRLIPVIAHDRAGFGSALLSVGLLVLMLALWGIREGERWVWWSFTIGAIPAFAAGILTHFLLTIRILSTCFLLTSHCFCM